MNLMSSFDILRIVGKAYGSIQSFIFFRYPENLINFQLTQELSNQGILDTSILSQYSQSQTSQVQPLEVD